MWPAPLDRKLLRDLSALRGQAAAIALVIAAGVALFVMALGTVQALEATLASYYRDYRFGQVFQQVVRAPERLADALAALPGVSAVQTRVSGPATLYPPGADLAVPGKVMSVPEAGQPRVNRLYLARGRWPERARPDEVLLGRAFAEARDLAPGDTLPAVIDGHRRQLRIVGLALSPEFIYALGPGQMVPQPGSFGVVWMGRTAAAAAYDMDGAFNDVALRLMHGSDPDAVLAASDRLLAPYGGSGGVLRKDQASHAFVRSEIDGLHATARISPPVFLAVAAFLLNVVIARMIERERPQIGLLKAFGYTDAAVGWHYAKLVLAITLAGTALGIGLGGWLARGLAEIYAEFFHFPVLRYRPDPRILTGAAAVALAVAALGGAVGVRRAAGLPPAVAMRPPEPPSFRHGLLERLGAVARLDPASRMILRNLARRPLRAALTTLGVASAVALLVGSLFYRESVDALIRAELSLAQRQDVTVGFADATAPAALHELAAIPGVLRAEGYRTAPARIASDNRSRRVALRGLAPGTRLQRVLTAEGRPVDAPEAGIALSRKLAEVLGVGRGQHVQVAILQGRRPTVRLPVTDVVTQYVGLAAYLDADTLARLLEPERALSGAYLAVDPARRDAVHAALLARPGVAGATWRDEVLQALRRTLDRNLVIITTIFVGFAGVIAVGVVYNAARIALSERGRELASLRVLGFTRGEVSYVLLGELALQVALALPLGCVLGYGFAWGMVQAYDSELIGLPFVVLPSTYAWSMLVAVVAAVASGWVVRRRIDRLDLVEVLKTRE